MAEQIHEQLIRIQQLMKVAEVNEGIFSSSPSSKIKNDVDKGKKVFSNINQTLTGSENIFNELRYIRHNLETFKLSPEEKTDIEANIDSLLKAQKDTNEVVLNFLSNRTKFQITTHPQQSAEPEEDLKPLSFNEPQSEPEPVGPKVVDMKSHVNQKDSEDRKNNNRLKAVQDPVDEPETPVVDFNGLRPVRKYFNPKNDRAHLEDWLVNRKMEALLNENVLNEAGAIAEGKFHLLFKTLIDQSAEIGDLVASKSGGKLNQDAIASIMGLAFENILTKGQKNFINDIKDIHQGYNRYKQAYVDLDRPDSAQDTGLEASQHIAPLPGSEAEKAAQMDVKPAKTDRTHEALDLAKEYLDAHGYDVDKTSIVEVAKLILKSKNF